MNNFDFGSNFCCCFVVCWVNVGCCHFRREAHVYTTRRGVQHLLSCPVNWGPLKPPHNIAVIRQEATMHSSVFQTLYDALLINEIHEGLHFSHTHATMNTFSCSLCRRTLFFALLFQSGLFPIETMFGWCCIKCLN